MSTKVTRRQFVKLAAGSVAVATVAACAPASPAGAPAAPEATAPSAVEPTAAPPPADAVPACDTNWGLEDIKKLTDARVEVTGWAPTLYNPVADVKSFNDQVFFRKMEELTNVHIGFEHASPDPSVDALALLMASGDLPDVIYVITAQQAAEYGMKGALEPLNDYLSASCPHFSSLMQDFPELGGNITAPDGKIYGFPRMFTQREVAVFAGCMIRKDWLDEVGMAVPETTDAYYETLKAFKAKDANRYPLTWDPRWLIWQWGVGSQGPNWGYDFYRDGDTILFGPQQPAYREALVYINKLYAEGLLDPEYPQTMTQADFLKTRMTTGISGAQLGWAASHLDAFNKVLAGEGGDQQLIGTFPPKGPYGHQEVLSSWGIIDYTNLTAIAKSSEQKELLAQYFDLYYSESGRKLMGWGINCDTFEVVDDKRQFTEKVMQHPNLSPSEYLWNYVSPNWMGAMDVDVEATQAILAPESWETKQLYAKIPDDIKLPVLYFTVEEQNMLKEIMTDVNTLVAESVDGFITGQKSLDADFDAFVDQLAGMRIPEAQAIYQASYDRFKAAGASS